MIYFFVGNNKNNSFSVIIKQFKIKIFQKIIFSMKILKHF